MEITLARSGLEATRHRSLDAATLAEATLAAGVDREPPLIFSSRESRCNALSHQAMHKIFWQAARRPR